MKNHLVLYYSHQLPIPVNDPANQNPLRLMKLSAMPWQCTIRLCALQQNRRWVWQCVSRVVAAVSRAMLVMLVARPRLAPAHHCTAILSYFLGTKNSKSPVFLIIHKLFMLQIIFSKIGFNNTPHDCLDVLCCVRTMNFYMPVMPGDTNCIKQSHSTLQHCTKSEAGPPAAAP